VAKINNADATDELVASDVVMLTSASDPDADAVLAADDPDPPATVVVESPPPEFEPPVVVGSDPVPTGAVVDPPLPDAAVVVVEVVAGLPVPAGVVVAAPVPTGAVVVVVVAALVAAGVVGEVVPDGGSVVGAAQY